MPHPMTDAAIRFPFAAPPEAGQSLEIAPGVLWFRIPLPWALDHVNAYALDEGDGWTLIDTGIYSPEAVVLWEQILAGPLAGRPVTRLVVTHHHPDHIGMAGWFLARGAELLISRTAWLYARMLVLDVEHAPTPQAVEFWRHAGLSAASIQRRQTETPWNFADVVHPIPPGFTRLEEGQALRMGGRDWVVRFGGGHAPDHATFWSGDLVIGGDQLLPGISPNIGVHPSEPAADPLGDWLESCARLAHHARPEHLVLPGHKLPFSGLPFRLAQLSENHETALQRLLEHLAIPRRATDCFSVLFRREIGPATEGLAMGESIAHLNHLLRRGQVTRVLREDGAWWWQAVTE